MSRRTYTAAAAGVQAAPNDGWSPGVVYESFAELEARVAAGTMSQTTLDGFRQSPQDRRRKYCYINHDVERYKAVMAMMLKRADPDELAENAHNIEEYRRLTRHDWPAEAAEFDTPPLDYRLKSLGMTQAEWDAHAAEQGWSVADSETHLSDRWLEKSALDSRDRRRDPLKKYRAEIPGVLDGDTPEAVAVAKKYLHLNCCGHDNFIRPGDFKTVEKHIGELYRCGVTAEWTAKAMVAMCFAWEEDPRANIKRIVRTRYEHFEQLGIPDSAKADRFKAVKWDALKSVKLPTFIWEDYIAHGSLAMFYGAPKAGKTFVALNLALCIVNALPFCGRATTFGPVLYVIAEGGKSEIAKRIHAWIRETVRERFPGREGLSKAARAELEKSREDYKAALELNIQNSLHIVPTAVMMDNPADVLALLGTNPDAFDFPSAANSGLVVIDTVMRCTSGSPNDADKMMAFVRGCDTLRTETGSAVLYVHHQGKDATRGATGSIHLIGAPDFVASLVRVRGNPERIFRVTEMRNGSDEQDDLIYRLPTVNLGMDDAGNDITTCRVEYLEHRPQKSEGKALKDIAEKDRRFTVLETIDKDKPQTVEALSEAYGVSGRTMARILKDLREAGYLHAKQLTVTKKGRAYLDGGGDDDEGEPE